MKLSEPTWDQYKSQIGAKRERIAAAQANGAKRMAAIVHGPIEDLLSMSAAARSRRMKWMYRKAIELALSKMAPGLTTPLDREQVGQHYANMKFSPQADDIEVPKADLDRTCRSLGRVVVETSVQTCLDELGPELAREFWNIAGVAQ